MSRLCLQDLCLFYIELQYLFTVQPSFQMVIYMYRPHTGWCPGKDKVACLQRKEAADITHQMVHRVYHIRTQTALYGLSVNIEAEIYSLLQHLCYLVILVSASGTVQGLGGVSVEIAEFSNYSTSIETF